MARTLKQYLDLMKHALGKTPDSRHRLIDTFNDAGRALVTAYPWRWRVSPPVVLPIVAGQSWIELPADFGQVQSLYFEGSQITRVIQTTLADINSRRQWQEFEPGALWITFEGSDRQTVDDTGQPHRRADIYPTQADGRTDLRMSYLRGWVDMREDDENKVPEIPANWERSLVLFARSFAVEIENQTDPYEVQALFGPSGEIARLVAEDAGRQRNMGRPTHSVAAAAYGAGGLRPHRRIGF